MAWRRPGAKPLSGPMMISLPTHTCVIWPQCVNIDITYSPASHGDIHMSIIQDGNTVNSSENNNFISILFCPALFKYILMKYIWHILWHSLSNLTSDNNVNHFTKCKIIQICILLSHNGTSRKNKKVHFREVHPAFPYVPLHMLMT